MWTLRYRHWTVAEKASCLFANLVSLQIMHLHKALKIYKLHTPKKLNQRHFKTRNNRTCLKITIISERSNLYQYKSGS